MSKDNLKNKWDLFGKYNIPAEIILTITKFLDVVDLQKFRLICKFLNGVMKVNFRAILKRNNIIEKERDKFVETTEEIKKYFSNISIKECNSVLEMEWTRKEIEQAVDSAFTDLCDKYLFYFKRKIKNAAYKPESISTFFFIISNERGFVYL